MYRFVSGASFATLPRIRHKLGSRRFPKDVKIKGYNLKQGGMKVPRTRQDGECLVTVTVVLTDF
jgi:hypothetical protein